MSWIKQHMLLFIGIIIVIVGVVWYGISDTSDVPLLSSDEPIPGTLAETNADQEIVGSLLALRSVNLTGTIFTDPAFVALKDFGTMLVPEAVGRPNPFAPLSGTSGNTTKPPAERTR